MAGTAEYATTFELIDTDRDGLISQQEFKHLLDALGGGEVAEEVAGSMFSSIDQDHDGKVTLRELSAYLGENPA